MQAHSSHRRLCAGSETEVKILTQALILLLAVAISPATAQSARVRVLILTGESDYPSHDWRTTTPFLRQILERTGRFDIKVAEEVHGLDSRSLAPYGLLVLACGHSC